MRKGFTLLEAMFASAISTLVGASLCTLFIGINRMIKQSYEESELALSFRQLREQMLFQTIREGGNAFWGGMLSAQNTSVSSSKVDYTAVGMDISSENVYTRTSQKYSIDEALNPTFYYLDDPRLYAVTISNALTRVSRSERIVIPYFGKEQLKDKKDKTNVFHDTP